MYLLLPDEVVNFSFPAVNGQDYFNKWREYAQEKRAQRGGAEWLKEYMPGASKMLEMADKMGVEGWSYGAYIERLVIDSIPFADTTYFEKNRDDFVALLSNRKYILEYIFGEFLAGGQTGEKGRVMMMVMCYFLPDETIDYQTQNGQYYFDQWRINAVDALNINGEAWVKEHMPGAWMMLEMAKEMESAE